MQTRRNPPLLPTFPWRLSYAPCLEDSPRRSDRPADRYPRHPAGRLALAAPVAAAGQREGHRGRVERRGRDRARPQWHPVHLWEDGPRRLLCVGLRPRTGPPVADGAAAPHRRGPAVRGVGGRHGRDGPIPAHAGGLPGGGGSPGRHSRPRRSRRSRPMPTASTRSWPRGIRCRRSSSSWGSSPSRGSPPTRWCGPR